MLGYYGSRAFHREVEAYARAHPVEYWVRCAPSRLVTSGPFTLEGAQERARANAREFGTDYEVIHCPDGRTHLGDLVAVASPLDLP